MGVSMLNLGAALPEMFMAVSALALLMLGVFAGKDKAFRILDTHAGIGLYDLNSQEMQKTGEWQLGIGKVLEADIPPQIAELLAPWLTAVRALNDGDTAPVTALRRALALALSYVLASARLRAPAGERSHAEHARQRRMRWCRVSEEWNTVLPSAVARRARSQTGRRARSQAGRRAHDTSEAPPLSWVSRAARKGVWPWTHIRRSRKDLPTRLRCDARKSQSSPRPSR